jgi:hypothetical protein
MKLPIVQLSPYPPEKDISKYFLQGLPVSKVIMYWLKDRRSGRRVRSPLFLRHRVHAGLRPQRSPNKWLSVE